MTITTRPYDGTGNLRPSASQLHELQQLMVAYGVPPVLQYLPQSLHGLSETIMTRSELYHTAMHIEDHYRYQQWLASTMAEVA